MENSTRAQRQRKGLIGGGLLIAYGIIGAFISYYRDSNSFNLIDMLDAGQFAVLHAVIWTIAGLCVMGWYGVIGGWKHPDSNANEDSQ
jgi:hypothetical protein